MNIFLWILLGLQASLLIKWTIKEKVFSKDKKLPRTIVERSNVIQFDGMGYPLRLVIMSDGDQVWLDTNEEDGDVVLKWNKSSCD